uniref:Uncharacterized protein n=1 Tax=Arundo donax TaxID=35708 RepID=A0A0A9BJP7_ARUDO
MMDVSVVSVLKTILICPRQQNWQSNISDCQVLIFFLSCRERIVELYFRHTYKTLICTI